tara:strand:- start:279 stop:443 length:165 start_codon:yes stop_codon:yes gene_type:complete
MDKILELEERIGKLEDIIHSFMKNWGPDIQKKRDQRDAIWDEMIRIVRLQKKKS